MTLRRGLLVAAVLLVGGTVLVAIPVVMFLVALGPSTDQSGGCGTSGSVNVGYHGASRDGLNKDQMANVAAIVTEGLRQHVPRQGIVVALAVAHQESGFSNYANDGEGTDLQWFQIDIARSLDLPHEAVGSDHGSLGVFQQQWPWWGSMATLMNPRKAADKFYDALLRIPGWRSMSVTVAGQAVQRSAHPDAYADDVPLARRLLADPDLAAPAGVTGATFDSGGDSGCAAVSVSPGSVAYPLPRTAASVDERNFGGNGARWAHGHTGSDLAAACGTPVLAATAGRVIVRTDQPWAGRWLVQVSTGVGQLTTWYGHMRALDVTDGQTVQAGQQIGQVGNLGNATGCHLHFEVHPRGGTIYQDDIDPTPWLRRNVGHAPTGTDPVDQDSGGFTVATFNTLGASHTTAHGKRPAMASGEVRTRGVIELLDRYHVDVVGLQEFQYAQARTFRTEAGATYATYSPPGDTENTIAWRRSRWEPLAADTVAIGYFDGHTRRMPMVRLRDRSTGREIEVVNVHNPADTAAYPHQAAYRSEAVDREARLLRQITSREQIPVILTGDLNDRHDVFCRLTGDAAMTSAAGGSNTGACRPPMGAGIDWIFGNHGVRFRDHTVVKGALVGRTSDHPFVVTRASAGPAQ